MVVKKYSNRRMYDTKTSSYVRLEELAERIRAGENIRVVDAESGQDLTHSILVQLIIESRGAARLLPEPLLVRLIRLDDAALAEFFGSWMGWALEMFLRGRQQAAAFASAFTPPWPAAAAPPAAPPAPGPAGPPPAAAQPPHAEPGWGTPPPGEWAADDASGVASGVRVKDGPASKDEVASLRREIDELKELIRGQARKRKSG